MKIVIFAVFFNLLTTLLVAQPSVAPAQVEWSREVKAPSGTDIIKIFPAADSAGGFFAVRVQTVSVFNSGSTFYLEYYNRQMTLVREKELDMKVDGKKRDFRDVLQIGGKIYLLTSFFNKKTEIAYLFSQRIDEKKLMLDKQLQKVSQIGAAEPTDVTDFDYQISKDSSKVLFFTRQKNIKSDEFVRVNLQVFDANLKPMSDRTVKLPYPANKTSIKEYQVDNQGNIYLLCEIYGANNLTRTIEKSNYSYTILRYAPEVEVSEEYKINVNDKFVTDLTFRIADDRQLTVIGFYSDKNRESMKGVFFQKINPVTKEIFGQRTTPFDFQLRTDYFSARQKEKARIAETKGDVQAQPELYRFSLENLVLRNDGGALLVGEQYFVEERTYRTWNGGFGMGGGGGNFQTDYYYNFNDILVVNIRPTGEVEWATRIPKNQVTVNDKGEFSSYAMTIIRDRICFIFNDNGKNFNAERKKLFAFTGDSDSVVTLAELKKDGSLQTFPLFNNADHDVLTRPKLCRQNGRKNMLLYGERGRFYRFGNLSFL